MALSSSDYLDKRIQLIAGLVAEYEGCEDADSEDLIHSAIRQGGHSSDQSIARHVAGLIGQP